MGESVCLLGGGQLLSEHSRLSLEVSDNSQHALWCSRLDLESQSHLIARIIDTVKGFVSF